LLFAIEAGDLLDLVKLLPFSQNSLSMVFLLSDRNFAAEVMAQAIQNAIHTSQIPDEEFLKFV